MRIRSRLAAVTLVALPGLAWAATARAAPASACQAPPEGPAGALWAALGGRDGRLGCPISREQPTAPSPKGTTVLETRFEGGAILRPQGGAPDAAFAVVACYRLYVQYGGSSGWLGAPISPEVNTPDGQRQRFEGGTLTYQRALDACDADRG